MDKRQYLLLSAAVLPKFIRFQKTELASMFQREKKPKATSLIEKDVLSFMNIGLSLVVDLMASTLPHQLYTLKGRLVFHHHVVSRPNKGTA